MDALEAKVRCLEVAMQLHIRMNECAPDLVAATGMILYNSLVNMDKLATTPAADTLGTLHVKRK